MSNWAGSYQPGRPYAICDRCGFRCRLDELRTEWTNLKVCGGCFDPRPVHLSTPDLRPGEGAPLPGARPDLVTATDGVLFSDGDQVLWSDQWPLFNDPVNWSDT